MAQIIRSGHGRGRVFIVAGVQELQPPPGSNLRNNLSLAGDQLQGERQAGQAEDSTGSAPAVSTAPNLVDNPTCAAIRGERIVRKRPADRQAGEAEDSAGSAPAISSAPNPVNNPTCDVIRGARIVRQLPAEQIMEKVWLPSCEGREIIEFATELTDLSKETFEV